MGLDSSCACATCRLALQTYLAVVYSMQTVHVWWVMHGNKHLSHLSVMSVCKQWNVIYDGNWQESQNPLYCQRWFELLAALSPPVFLAVLLWNLNAKQHTHTLHWTDNRLMIQPIVRCYSRKWVASRNTLVLALVHTAAMCSLQERVLISNLNDCTLSTEELFIVINGGGSLLT